MCILAEIGRAGAPGGSQPLMVGVLMTIGVPPQSIAVILSLDRVPDDFERHGDLVIAAGLKIPKAGSKIHKPQPQRQRNPPKS